VKPPASPYSGRIVVSVFCGGRGGSSLIREFLRRPQVELHALINAYDDGMSTGELRGFIPGMLGPSDFRKNLANFLHWHSNYQYALTRLLEFRMSEVDQEKEVACLKQWARSGADGDETLVSENLRSVMRELDRMSPRVRGYLGAFFDYQTQQDQAFQFGDCSIGNLVFAGAYLKNNRNFQRRCRRTGAGISFAGPAPERHPGRESHPGRPEGGWLDPGTRSENCRPPKRGQNRRSLLSGEPPVSG